MTSDLLADASETKRSGKNHWNFGKKHPEMMGDKNVAKKPEVRKKISIKNRGKLNGMYGKPSPRKGIKTSNETIIKLKSTWTLEKRIKARVDAKKAKNTGRGKGCYYYNPPQGRIWLKSSYEVAYAKWLDTHNILWTYEPQMFDLGETAYIPDFYLINEHKYIEIKGYMRPKARVKIELFKEIFPHNILVVLNKTSLKKMGVL